MQKLLLQFLLLLSVTILFSSCTTLNPMMSYVQASVKTTTHKVKSKHKYSRKDPQLKHFHTQTQFAIDFLKVTPKVSLPSSALITQSTATFPTLNLPATTPADEQNFLRDEMVCYAKNYLGIPYRSGGKSAKGFDCSGFTSYVMANFGYNVPSASVRQAEIGETIPFEKAKKGDLIFFGNKGKNGKYRVTHAALVVSEEGEDLAMIHSARRGIVIDDINSSSWKKYYAKRFLHVKRVLPYKF